MTSAQNQRNGSRDRDHAHWGYFVIRRLIRDVAYPCTQFDDASFSCSTDMNKDQKHKHRDDLG